MTTKTINIAGKEVTLAYCNATQIAYKILSGEEIADFFQNDVFPAVKAKPPRMPDTKKTIFLTIAAARTYYDFVEQECPLTDKDLMYNAKANDLPDALGVILELYGKFYQTPAGDPEDDKDEADTANEKNA